MWRVEAILRAADDASLDLIVVRSNDKGFVQRLLGGLDTCAEAVL
jgi:hypothetical protein